MISKVIIFIVLFSSSFLYANENLMKEKIELEFVKLKGNLESIQNSSIELSLNEKNNFVETNSFYTPVFQAKVNAYPHGSYYYCLFYKTALKTIPFDSSFLQLLLYDFLNFGLGDELILIKMNEGRSCSLQYLANEKPAVKLSGISKFKIKINQNQVDSSRPLSIGVYFKDYFNKERSLDIVFRSLRTLRFLSQEESVSTYKTPSIKKKYASSNPFHFFKGAMVFDAERGSEITKTQEGHESVCHLQNKNLDTIISFRCETDCLYGWMTIPSLYSSENNVIKKCKISEDDECGKSEGVPCIRDIGPYTCDEDELKDKLYCQKELMPTCVGDVILCR